MRTRERRTGAILYLSRRCPCAANSLAITRRLKLRFHCRQSALPRETERCDAGMCYCIALSCQSDLAMIRIRKRANGNEICLWDLWWSHRCCWRRDNARGLVLRALVFCTVGYFARLEIGAGLRASGKPESEPKNCAALAGRPDYDPYTKEPRRRTNGSSLTAPRVPRSEKQRKSQNGNR